MPALKKIWILNNGAFQLLQAMEAMSLIRVEEDEPQTAQKQSLGERFAGCLHLSGEEYAEFHRQAREGRDEWEQREIFSTPTLS